MLEPGPVVLLTTAIKGRANLMAMSGHMMVEFEPPLVACIVSNANYSFAALRATKECVIAIPAPELAPKVVEIGNCSGRDVDKFERIGLTPGQPSAWRHLWWPSASPISNARWPTAGLVIKYSLFVLEVVKAWMAPAQRAPKTIHHHGYGKFSVEGAMIKLKSKKP